MKKEHPFVVELRYPKPLTIHIKGSFMCMVNTFSLQSNDKIYYILLATTVATIVYHNKASPWPYERRVVCKVEKPKNQMVYLYTFIVTNMDSSPEYLAKFYCKSSSFSKIYHIQAV